MPRRQPLHGLGTSGTLRIGTATSSRQQQLGLRRCLCSSAADPAPASLLRETRFRQIYDVRAARCFLRLWDGTGS